MAATNGILKHEENISVSYLGKRKRATSPENRESQDSVSKPAFADVLQLLRRCVDGIAHEVGDLTDPESRHDSTPSLLRHPLPRANSDLPDLKRARLLHPDTVNNTIEDRLQNGTYQSLHSLNDDLKRAYETILADASEGGEEGRASTDLERQLAKILSILENHDRESPSKVKTESGPTTKGDSANSNPQHFLSLRSNVNGNPRMLYSGVEAQQELANGEANGLTEKVGLGLPNGFELLDFSALGEEGENSEKQEKRTFEKVFTALRRLKPLDLPHSAKDVVRGSTLNFIPHSSRTENLPVNKHDYKHAKLPTISWLSYRTSYDRRRVSQPSTGTDPKTPLAASNDRQGKDEAELFSLAYSSFAPTTDNATSLVSDEDVRRKWWTQQGEQRKTLLFRPTEQEDPLQGGAALDGDEFDDLVASFQPEAEDDIISSDAEKEVDTLLEEVSDMIETLSSYQRNRSLDIIASGKVQKPDKPEFDMYELLRNQLSLLVASLPPFAVAKLNGDQLENLNISTRLSVEVPDYPGTGQPDDYLVRRQKMAQQAPQVTSRPTITPQPVRPGYSSIQASTINYNPQLRGGYNPPVPGTAAYGIRSTANYNTPTLTRPNYSQNATFQASSTTHNYPGNRPTIQQFQRPALQNGYNNYGGTKTPLQPSQSQTQAQTPATHAQRPTQPGYQQRAQDNAAALARSASPQKPQGSATVASAPYTPRPYQPQQAQIPTGAQQHGQARQGGGTTSTAIQQGIAARYNGLADQPTSTQGPGGAVQNLPEQGRPSVTQIVEVSR